MGWFEGVTWRWVISWKRRLAPEESQNELMLFNLIQVYYPKRYQNDEVTWCNNNVFTVKSLYYKANTQADQAKGQW